MEKKKKTWAVPELTALVRRKPEEGILSACKAAYGGGALGPGDDETACFLVMDLCGACNQQVET